MGMKLPLIYFLKMVEWILVSLVTTEMLAFTKHLGGGLLVLLEDSRVDPSVVNYCGDTCLHIAAYKGHERTVRLLLKDGRANPSAINNEGLDCLSVTTHPTIRKMLEDDRMNRRLISSCVSL
jgi:ankyrin repeat protein